MDRDLKADLKWLTDGQRRWDLSDEYLINSGHFSREFYKDRVCEFSYGITFVESWIAECWLKRAIELEKINEELNQSLKVLEEKDNG